MRTLSLRPACLPACRRRKVGESTDGLRILELFRICFRCSNVLSTSSHWLTIHIWFSPRRQCLPLTLLSDGLLWRDAARTEPAPEEAPGPFRRHGRTPRSNSPRSRRPPRGSSPWPFSDLTPLQGRRTEPTAPKAPFSRPFRAHGPSPGDGLAAHAIGRAEIAYIGLLNIVRQLGICGMKPIDCTVSRIHTVQSIDKTLYYAS